MLTILQDNIHVNISTLYMYMLIYMYIPFDNTVLK